jgi:DNA polymerase V
VEVGAKLRKLRETKGWRLEDVAARANMSVGQLSRLELGTRNLDVADFINLCGVLGELPGDLLPHSGEAPKHLRLVDPIAEGLASLPEPQQEAMIHSFRVQLQALSPFLRIAEPSRDNVLDFVPAKAEVIPTSSEQIDSLEKAMRSLGAEPRRARRGQDFSVPLIANLSAGKGLETFTREHESRDINAYYWNRGVRAVFRVVGNSMLDMGITDRDLVYVRPVEVSAPKNGDVIACTLNEESFVKVYEHDADGRTWLKSKATGFDPIEVKEGDELRIWGVVLGRTGDL